MRTGGSVPAYTDITISRRRFCRTALAGGIVMTVFGGRAAASSLSAEFGRHSPESQITIDHGAFTRFLDTWLQPVPGGVNRLNYAGVTGADHRALKAYIRNLETMEPAALSRDEQFAFWANLYNALTIDVVLDAWPVGSIRDIKPAWIAFGPWKEERVRVAGRSLSLDHIEHDILRAIWGDPRVHYAVNCASIGCPNLHKQPFERRNLNERLNAYAREYVNHSRGAKFDQRGRLHVSRIYNWFRKDFGGTQQGVIDHLRRYADTGLNRRLARVTHIHGYMYDWSLNAPPDKDGIAYGGN